MRPHAESVSIGTPGPGHVGPCLGSGKAGGVRPRQTHSRSAPELGAHGAWLQGLARLRPAPSHPAPPGAAAADRRLVPQGSAAARAARKRPRRLLTAA
ncbi:hypothetical protein G6F65_023342 [Rhizopus arrhizus]|nr:hypothetical protein G6F65_023342 [Rhizopus arrhizus]